MPYSLELPSWGTPLKKKKKRVAPKKKIKKRIYRYSVAFEKNGVVNARKFQTLERAQQFRAFIRIQPEVNQVSGIKTL